MNYAANMSFKKTRPCEGHFGNQDSGMPFCLFLGSVKARAYDALANIAPIADLNRSPRFLYARINSRRLLSLFGLEARNVWIFFPALGDVTLTRASRLSLPAN